MGSLQVEDIAACWEDLAVPLAQRALFYTERCAAHRVALTRLKGLRGEARKLHAQRHKLRREHPGAALAETPEVVAAHDALQKERQALYKSLKRLKEDDKAWRFLTDPTMNPRTLNSCPPRAGKATLFDAWRIPSDSRARKEQLIMSLWAPQADLAQSAGVVIWLTGGGENPKARQMALSGPPGP